MWKMNKINVYEIVDESTNRVIVTGLEESQAAVLCEKHNAILTMLKWEKPVEKP